MVVPESVALPVSEEKAVVRDRRQLGLDRLHGSGEAVVGHEHHRIRVVDQRNDGPLPQQGAQRHHYGADLGTSPINLEKFHAVRKEGGYLLALIHPEGQQGIGQAVDLQVELPIGQAAVFKDNRQVVRTVFCVS
jgi:hypothetical protein